ncbi:MAG: phosphatidate cytidylyltransferase [Nitriliruptoraceae bacterium]
MLRSRTPNLTGGRDLPLAIVVGLALATVTFGALFYHPIAFTIVIGVVTAIAYLELRIVLRPVGRRIDVVVLMVATATMLFGAYNARHAGQTIGVLILLFGAFLWHAADAERQDVVQSAATTLFFGLWVGFLASFGVLLVTRPDTGVIAVLAVVGAAAVHDIGAFAAGVKFGRHKIAPTLSPNKTWEGLAGGMLAAVIFGVGVLPFVGRLFDFLSGAIVAGLVALASFSGDLVESMVKRDLGVKDLGEVLPGHGGILDRVDGILFALPVGFYAIELFA